MGSRIDIRNEGGAALIMALGVMTIMVIIGILVITLSMNTTKTVGHDIRLTEAQNIAEAGIDEAIALTLANYDEVYMGGIPDYPGDGLPFFDSPQQLTDSQGNVIGSYEVWTKADPDRPGNVLLTAIGTMDSGNPQTSTVRVSVRYTAEIFDYVLLVGDPDITYSTGGNDSDDVDNDSDDVGCLPRLQIHASNGSATLTGNVHVNGCMQLLSNNSSIDNPGTVAFLSRDGYSDTVTYTTNYQGHAPTGNQPQQVSDPVDFPTVDFNSFTDVVTVNLPNSGTPSGSGWTRNGSKFFISAQDFQNNYGSYEAVKFTAADNSQFRIEITGSGNASNPWTITSSILIPASSSITSPSIEEFKLKGPGLSLQPTNGLAVISAQGEINVEDGTVIGAPGAGALMFATGQNDQAMFNMESGTVVYGSVVVSPPEVELNATGSGGGTASDDEDDVTGSITLTYDPAFLTSMPTDWWDGGGITAIKVNFERD